jgi:hypothetical protein
MKKIKEVAVVADPKNINTICKHIANGGTMISICRLWGVDSSEVLRQIRSNDETKKLYDQALEDRKEYFRERTIEEVQRLATYNIKDALEADGRMKKVQDMPDEFTAAIREIDSDGGIKFVDKVKPLEMLAKLAGIADKVEVSGKMTLEQMLIAASKDEKE